ncbi:YdcF family protein [Elioraea rosea]|uniref:YdcF family protein n=1 Tax=Elioraea rosea TaxID=2492390 RepID=UPI001185579C|nr:YdcF family protein [Elioraea rosea]
MTTLSYVLSKVLWFVLRPGTFALILALIGLAAMWRGRRWGRWPLLAGLGFFVMVIVTPIGQLMLIPLEERFSRPVEAPARVDGIVVLGGAVDQNLTEARGIPALNGAAERMTEAVALARRYPEARIVFTGGQGSLIHGGLTEADVARQLWTAMGLDPSRMTYESESRNTHQNAVLTYALVEPKPGETWLLVTSASHMPRSVGVFRHAGWQVVPWPVNYRTGRSLAALYDAPFPERIGQFEGALREWVGLVAYWLMGRMETPFPGP